MPTNLTDIDAFTSPIVIPADGDDIDESVHTPGFQGLANRTRNLLNKLLGLTNGEFLYTTAGTPTVRSKHIFLPIELGVPDGAAWSDTTGWQFTVPNGKVKVPCSLPPGVVITGIEFGFDNQTSAGSGAVGVRIKRLTPDTAAGTPNAVSGGLLIQNTVVVNGGVGGNLAFTSAIDDASRIMISIEAGAGNGSGQYGRCTWIKVTFNDPGPRNGA